MGEEGEEGEEWTHRGDTSETNEQKNDFSRFCFLVLCDDQFCLIHLRIFQRVEIKFVFLELFMSNI